MILEEEEFLEEQFDKFIETSKNISELPLFIDETPAITIAAVSNRARRIKRLFGLEMIVIDYIQLMRGTLPKMEKFKKFQKLLKA